MSVLFFAVFLFFSQMLYASPLKNIVVFGDSLSDNGNLYGYLKIPVPPYFEGRFTNGTVWVERVATHYWGDAYPAHLVDHAVGGATVSDETSKGLDDSQDLYSFQNQIHTYLASHNDTADKNSLFFVWIGANNYIGLPEDDETAVTQVITGIDHGVESLIQRGAKNIVFSNLPDLGLIPAGRMIDESEKLTELSFTHNQRLKELMEALQVKYPDVHFILIDVNGLFESMLNNPSRYGFNNTTEPCVDFFAKEKDQAGFSVIKMTANSKQNDTPDCEGYMFFDPIHPTARAHQFMADIAVSKFNEEGITFEDSTT